MQPSEDALDFLDSLLLFDRICPFALEKLPAMSRRVFDVGLDMNRIKHGLKVKPDAKRSKSSRSASISAPHDVPAKNEETAMVSRLPRKRSSPTMGTHDDKSSGPAGDALDLPSPRTPRPNDPTLDYPTSAPSQISSPTNGDHFSRSMRPDSPTDDAQNFELRPPPPNKSVKNLDILSEQLFSGDHLRVILRDPSFFLRFTAFLNRYKPNLAPVLVRYLEAQKAIKAVEYANALAESIKPLPGDPAAHIPCAAASIDPRFEARARRGFETLVNEALPAYITHAFTRVVTEMVVREITGSSMPLMRELVGGLAETFCLADPSLKDCPIVYASEG